ncbi:NBR1-Ig-like domain-containing protein [Nonomuraea sp. GTA35]|uniref:NBR1-Ig-like domain-containing protein n=1 Tax=Nonomuraea sp. GTA35 TaxID=1676746 RepID=UPI0035BF154D
MTQSSLAAAARGSTLPSWETTWELVRVLAVERLGRDAGEVRREWRAYWEEAAMGGPATSREDARVPGTPRAENPPPPPSEDEHPSPEASHPSPDGGRSRRGRRDAVLVGWVLPHVVDDAESEPAARPTPPITPYDDSVFEKDVTYPDGTVVQSGTSFGKTWRIRNTGNLPWQDRYLTRMNDTPCEAPKRVAMGPVLPGESVDITVRVRASDSPGRCKIGR